MIRRTAPLQAARATRRAFTLLEVLVVVAIIVMLAGVGGYFIIQRYEEGKIGMARTRAKDIATKVENFYINNGHYPASIVDLVNRQPNGGDPMLPEEGVKDPWMKPFQIEFAQDGHGVDRVVVFTLGPKGQRISNIN